MTNHKKYSLRRSLATLIFTGLLCIASPLSSLSFVAILAGSLLGGIQGAGATGLFIILGCSGLKIFPGTQGGMEYLTGPFGGSLISAFIASLASGIILGTPHNFEKIPSRKNLIKTIIAISVAFVLSDSVTIPWFIRIASTNKESLYYAIFNSCPIRIAIQKAFQITMEPFIVIKIIECILAIPFTLFLRPKLGNLLYQDDEKEKEEILNTMKKTVEKKNKKN